MDHQMGRIDESYDLLETQVDLWYEPKAESPHQVLIPAKLLDSVLVPKGSRMLCLGFSCDQTVPILDGLGDFKNVQLAAPYLYLDGITFLYIGMKGCSFEEVFKSVASIEDAV